MEEYCRAIYSSDSAAPSMLLNYPRFRIQSLGRARCMADARLGSLMRWGTVGARFALHGCWPEVFMYEMAKYCDSGVRRVACFSVPNLSDKSVRIVQGCTDEMSRVVRECY